MTKRISVIKPLIVVQLSCGLMVACDMPKSSALFEGNPVGFIYGPDTQGVEGKVAVVGDGDIGGCRLKKKR